MVSILAEKRRLIAERWMESIFRSYPAQSAQTMLHGQDPFRNPVGHAFLEGVPVLCDELFEAMDERRIVPALENIVRIRAVQDFSAREAVGFVFMLKKILREQSCDGAEDEPEIADRIDRMALMAFDLYVRCREDIHEARMGEVRRKVGLLEKMYSGA
jgi:RsbT co-antagonist protein rsbRD N-terminal domain